jgi:hemerythrin
MSAQGRPVSDADRPHERSVSETLFSEHRDLVTLFVETGAALCQTRCAAEAREAFARLRDALETHFGQEERLYYPTIWALRPERKPPLLRFVRAHEQFRARMGEIAGRLERDLLEDAARGLAEFVQTVGGHQLEEEDLLRSLDQELAGRPL